MPLAFTNSPKPTLGIEVEIQLIDRVTKNLSSAAVPLLDEASKVEGLTLKAELSQAMAEINTEICDDIAQARASLARQLDRVRALADKRGIDIAVSGTHPFQDWRERQIFPDPRHIDILEKYQWLARRWTTFGLHVHVGVRGGDRAIHILNTLISYIPHLLALSASSPYWGGTDTGLMSCRAAVLESFPTGGLPYYLTDWKAFEKYFETLMSTGAIKSIKDIYWDIRPHFDFGTVEVRVCDGLPNLKDTMALAALIHCLVVWIDDQYQKGRSQKVNMQRYWLAPENKWQAVRYGFEGILINPESGERSVIREDIERLLANLAPVADSLNCAQELAGVRDILKAGNSTMRQREIFAKTKSLVAVVEWLIEELKGG
ncbi:MAG TPA: glutamate--cysteine ligase [bacterium]|nr:glutamate--cysteine ligase [bacterium]